MGVLLEVAEQQIALRNAKHNLEAITAGLALGVGGKNAEERKAALAQALHTDREAVAAKQAVMRLEADLMRLEAMVEERRERRRQAEWDIRARLVAALEAANSGARRDDIGDDRSAFEVADDYAEAAAIRGALHGIPL